MKEVINLYEQKKVTEIPEDIKIKIEYLISNMFENIELNAKNEDIDKTRSIIKDNPSELFNNDSTIPGLVRAGMSKLERDIENRFGIKIAQVEPETINDLFNSMINNSNITELNPKVLGGLAEEIAIEEEQEGLRKAA